MDLVGAGAIVLAMSALVWLIGNSNWVGNRNRMGCGPAVGLGAVIAVVVIIWQWIT